MTSSGKEWTTISGLRDSLRKKWDRGIILRELLKPEGVFPVRIPLSGPGPSQLSNRFNEARGWIQEFASLTGPFEIEWKEVNNRVLGQNRIPVYAVFRDPAGVAAFIGKEKEYSLFMEVSRELLSVFPALESWVLKNANSVISLKQALSRLIDVALWITKNPGPGIYLRQLCIEGVDTKFIESYKKVLGEWLDVLLPSHCMNSGYTGTKYFEQRFGFLSKPLLVRFRMLEGKRAGGFSDLTVRADEFCQVAQEADVVFVIENDINCLAFPPVRNGMVIFGRGYGFDFLADAGWLKTKKIWYWGDIDTHGLAILSQFRKIFPDARSFLMNRNTLLACRQSWSIEADKSNILPSNLNAEEMQLFLDLKEDRFGKSVRLEQEFIPYRMVIAALEGSDS